MAPSPEQLGTRRHPGSAQREQLHPRGGCSSAGQDADGFGVFEVIQNHPWVQQTSRVCPLPVFTHPNSPCWTGELLLFSCQLALVQLGPFCLSPKHPCSSRAGSCTHPRARPSSPSPPQHCRLCTPGARPHPSLPAPTLSPWCSPPHQSPESPGTPQKLP